MIPSNKPSIVRKDMDVVLTCLVSEEVGAGEKAEKEVRSIGKELGFYGGLGFSDPQRCLETAFSALELEAGDKVALSPLSPHWFSRVLADRGLVPVFWDVDPDTCLPRWEGDFGEGVKAAVCHHVLGILADTTYWEEMAVPVIEDLTSVVGALTLREIPEPRGTYGFIDLGGAGHLTGGGGGLLFSRGKKEHSAVKALWSSLADGGRLSDLHAAFMASQWSRLDRFVKKRQEILEIFKASLLKSRHRGFALSEEAVFLPPSYPVLLSTGGQETFSFAKKKKVSCINAFKESILMRYPEGTDGLDGAKQLSLRCVLFPLYPSLSNGEIELISKVLASLP